MRGSVRGGLQTAASSSARAETAKLHALSASFTDPALEEHFRRATLATHRGTMKRFLVLSLLLYMVIALAVSSDWPTLTSSCVLALATLYLLVVFWRDGAFSSAFVQRRVFVMLDVYYLLSAGQIAFIALRAWGHLCPPVELAAIETGDQCEDRFACLMLEPNTRYFNLGLMAVLSALPIVNHTTFMVIGAFATAVHAAGVGAFSPGQWFPVIVSVLFMLVFTTISFGRHRDDRLRFLYDQHFAGSKITIAVEREALFSWFRSGAVEDELPPWAIDAAAIKRGALLGKGAFGQVFLGQWKGVAVAIKELLPDQAHEAAGEDGAALLEAFADEIALLSSLRHPHILSFYGCALSEEKTLLLVTEFCDHGSIEDLVAEQGLRITFPMLVEMLEGASKGLAYLHGLQPPIVHQDIKPANLLVGKHLEVKIGDFGLAQLQGRDKDDIGAGDRGSGGPARPVGTLLFTAPEVLLGEAAASASSDVFSFAVTMFALAANAVPYERELGRLQQPLAVALQVASGLRPDVDLLRGDATPAFRALMERCWAGEAAARPSFEAIAIELAQIAAGPRRTPTSARGSMLSRLSMHESSNLVAELPALLRVTTVGDQLLVQDAAKIGESQALLQAMFDAAIEVIKATGGRVAHCDWDGVTARFEQIDAAAGAALSALEHIGRLLGQTKLLGSVSYTAALHWGDDLEAARRVVKAGQDLVGRQHCVAATAEAQAAGETHFMNESIEVKAIGNGLFELRRIAGGSEMALPPVSRTTGAPVADLTTLSVDGSRLTAVEPLTAGLERATLDGAPVAIKQIGARQSVADMARLKGEVALARLIAPEHAHVGRVMGLCSRYPRLGLVREWLPVCIRDVLDAGRVLGERHRSAIVAQMSSAAHFLDGHGIETTRSLHAGNVMLRSNDDGAAAVLCDHGRATTGAATATMTTHHTIAHMAPEVLSGRGSAGSKSTVWALGILAAQLEAGTVDILNERGKGSVGRVVTELISGALVPEVQDAVGRACLVVDVDERPTLDDITAMASAAISRET